MNAMRDIYTSWQREKSALSILQVSKATVYRWRLKGTIQSRKIGAIRYYDVGEFLKRLEEGEPDQRV
jgi:predicted site-specific integrase-resolvase